MKLFHALFASLALLTAGCGTEAAAPTQPEPGTLEFTIDILGCLVPGTCTEKLTSVDALDGSVSGGPYGGFFDLESVIATGGMIQGSYGFITFDTSEVFWNTAAELTVEIFPLVEECTDGQLILDILAVPEDEYADWESCFLPFQQPANPPGCSIPSLQIVTGGPSAILLDRTPAGTYRAVIQRPADPGGADRYSAYNMLTKNYLWAPGATPPRYVSLGMSGYTCQPLGYGGTIEDGGNHGGSGKPPSLTVRF